MLVCNILNDKTILFSKIRFSEKRICANLAWVDIGTRWSSILRNAVYDDIISFF